MDLDAERFLVARLRSGDAAALDEVFEAFHPRIVAFLIRLSRSREVAEDLAEETWLRIITHVTRLRADSRLAPWIFTVARNLYISYCRSRALEDAWSPVLLGLWPSATSPSSPFEEIARNEIERRLEAAIATLPARLREVILLIGVEGFSQAEAATMCGISPEALRQRLRRARAALAKRLGDDRGGATALREALT